MHHENSSLDRKRRRLAGANRAQYANIARLPQPACQPPSAAITATAAYEKKHRRPALPVSVVKHGQHDAGFEGHFYDPPPAKGDEWLFAPVEFEHLVLDATRPVDENVAKLLPLVRRPS